MKRITITLLIAGLIFLLPLIGAEEKEEAKKTVDVKLTIGAKATAKDGEQLKVNEYSPVDKGVRPVVKAKIAAASGKTYFNLFSNFRGDLKDQFHKLSFDFGRVLKQKFTYDALYHRLDHDPLTNIDVVSHARSAAYVTDFNPTDQYHITRYLLESSTQITIPKLSFLKIYVDYRNEHRSGEYQARTLSKCSACHVVAKSRSINNLNQDIRIGGVFSFGKASIDYSFTNNTFTERDAAPTNHYLKVEHPEKMIPVFTSRIGVGDDQVLPFDGIPDSKKNTHLVKAAVPVAKNSTLSAQFVNAAVENTTANLRWKTNSLAGAFSSRIGRKGFFNIRFRQIKIDNDSVFVDINEPLDIGGPNVGFTYAEVSGVGTFDFIRNSALSRSVFDIDANLRYKLAKTLRLRLGAEYKQVKREYYDVGNTKSTTFKGKLTFKPVKGLKFNLGGMFRSISDPFANLYGGVAPAQQTVAYDNPFVGVQFFQWHADRRATLTNFPESVKEIKGGAFWGPSAKFAVSGHFLIRNEDNDNLNLTGAVWSRDLTQWSVNMWFALGKKFPVSATYYSYKNKYDSLFAIAALEGCGAGIIGGMTGTLTDMMGYDIETQTILVNFSYMAGKKFSLHCSFNYNDSISEMKDLIIDISQVPYLPGSEATALNFDDYGGVAEYSKLDMKQMIAELGFKFALSKKWYLNGAFYYYFYDDIAEYLFTDTTGKSYSFFAGFTYVN
ncbi:MAG: MtrB/PioB family outer membrane beta-barrel protein [Candidatus Aminicenantes bacterium]|nr:MtrB/PioB family outer membrane beta-barrel protein [Candidatus Aminicenantes bacterium]